MILVYVTGLFVVVCSVQGIANTKDEKNVITDEERRGVSKHEIPTQGNNDQAKAHTHRGLIITTNTRRQPTPYLPGHGFSGLGGTGPEYPKYGPSGGSGYVPSNGPSVYHGYGSGYDGPSGGPSGSSGYGHDDFGYGGGNGDYGHSGPEASPPQSHGHSALALKGLLLPFAGLVILGAAAALSTNPILLQLGVISGRRRRRNVRRRTFDDAPLPVQFRLPNI